MKIRNYLILGVLGVFVGLIIGWFQQSAGYMDAQYYHATGQQIAQGNGFEETFIWNFLDDPDGVPRPSHGYWMPLASMVAATGMRLMGSYGIHSARLGFLILMGFVAPITAALAEKLGQRQNSSILAGILALVPVFYLPFLATTDTFALYMIFGGIFFLILLCENLGPISTLGLGLIVGLMHLSRADGLVWLPIACVSVLHLSEPKTPFKIHQYRVGLVILGYLLIMTPWFVRNFHAFGSILSPGGAKAFWFTTYNELFAYPAVMLTPSRWWATGVSEIWRVRIWALGQNLQNFVAVQGAVFLAPLIIFGAWKQRKAKPVQVGVFAWLTTLAVMTVVFPFAGARGGFFHSGAALQPLLWALAAVGLESFLGWGNRRRGWGKEQARLVFSIAIVAMALGLSLYILNQRVISNGAWDQSHREYESLEMQLLTLGASPQDLVLVNNPPGYFLAAGRMSIVIPDGDASTLLDVAQRYQAKYVILESNHPTGLDILYHQPQSISGLEMIWSDGDAHIFQVLD